jgi:hypothetical protein
MKSLEQSITFLGIEVAGKEETHLINGFNFPVDSTTLSGSKSQSQTYLDNTRINEGKYKSRYKTKYKKKKKLSERLSSYYQTKTRLSRLYDSIGNEKKAKQVFKCCSFVTMRTCGDHILGRAVNYRCFDRLCPECSNKRSNRLFYDYEPIVNEFIATYDKSLRPIHLVLTQMQKPNETIKESHQRIKKAFKKLVDRKFWKESFAGSLNSFEFTISSRTFADGAVHFHGHILAFCKLADKDRNKVWLNDFRQEWSAVSNGENKNLKLMPVTDLKNALREVLKYQVKPQSIENLTPERLSEIEGLHHSRMTSVSGDFHTFVKAYRREQKIASDNVEKDPQTAQKVLSVTDPCPLCLKPLYDVSMPVKASIVFIQQIENRLDLFGIPPS